MESDAIPLSIVTAAAIVLVIAAIILAAKAFRLFLKKRSKNQLEEDVMSLLRTGEKKGEIKKATVKMIESVFQFDDKYANEIMTPRTDVFMIDINDPQGEYFDELMSMRYSRIPVYEEEIDNIIGVLNVKDYLIKARDEGFGKVDIKPILRAPLFVPETKSIDTLFHEMQQEKQHIAILIDEYGGFSGIVTMEDIIEEIVGDIDDEYDESHEMIHKISDNRFIVDGSVSLDDLNDATGADLESETSETIGGLLIDQIGEIPDDGYVNMTVEYENYTFTIISVSDRRIKRLKMVIRSKGEEDE